MYRSLQARFGGSLVTYISFFSLFCCFPSEASRCAVFVGPQMVGKLVMVSMGMYASVWSSLEIVYIDECPMSLRRRDFSAFPVPEVFSHKGTNQTNSTHIKKNTLHPISPTHQHTPSSPLSLTSFGLECRRIFWGSFYFYSRLVHEESTRAGRHED